MSKITVSWCLTPEQIELLNIIEQYAIAYADWQVAGVLDNRCGEYSRMLQARDKLHDALAKLEKP